MLPDPPPPPADPAPPVGTLAPLDPAVQTVWRIGAGLAGALAVVVVAAFDVVRVVRPERAVPLGLPTLVVLAAVVEAVVWVPRRRYAAWRYGLTADELRVEHGVVTQVRTTVPLRRVQHLDVTRGVVEREYGLARLVVHTAGTHAATVTVPGLPLATAEALRDRVRAFVTAEDGI